MSERLVFELQAIDRATAPLKQVQGELDRTSAAVRRHAASYDSASVSGRKWAMGALQQVGYQVGDFAVQLANGTNKMQAFGQQAPQILQVFGPLGAIVGAGVAIFAAFSVAIDKTAQSASKLTEALGFLRDTSASLATQMDMLRFGVDTEQEAVVLKSLADLYEQIRQKTIERNAASGPTRATLDKELIVLTKQRLELEGSLRTLNERRNALNTAKAINDQMMAVELGHARAIGQAERDRIAEGERIYQQMLAIQGGQAQYIQQQESFNQRLKDGYVLYGYLRSQAQGLAADAAAAAQAAVDPQNFKLAGAYQLYANTRMAAPKEPASEPKKPKAPGGGGKEDPLKTLREQIALEQELLGKTEAQQRVIQALGIDYKKYGEETFTALVNQINGMDALNKAAERQKEIADTIRSSFSEAFMSMVDGTKSVKDAFRDMARSIIAKLYDVLVVQQIVNGVMGLVGKAFPALAPAISGTKAMGGPVTGGKAYLVGERGPEIVVPSRNASVVPNSQIDGGGVTVVQNINISTGVQQTVRNEIRSLMPQIADSAKAAVIDARRRGGQMKAAFG